MPSKYTATVGFSQDDLDALSAINPSINDLTQFKNPSQIIQHFLNRVISGEFVEKTSLFSKELDELNKEKIRQIILKLKIANKKSLIHDLKVPPFEAVEITNGTILIENSSSALARMNTEMVMNSQMPNHNEKSPYNPALNWYDTKTKTVYARLTCTDCGKSPPEFTFIKESWLSFDSMLSAYRDHLDKEHKKRDTTIAENKAIEMLTEGCKI